ncbi:MULTISPECIES: transcriptional regulator [unclassified Xanthobacter]|uniref:transcriptional regulator n=1 Tax=unclassified Xanthobacter TaxID=2623496 RepID=UPI001EDF7B3E|nr:MULTISPECIES: transcriptional regulator [unclassified Xanthobacter]
MRSGWGNEPPDYIVALADACALESQAAVGRRIGVSGSQVCQVLGNRYPASLDGIEQRIRGALMGATVVCRELGEIGRDRCMSWQTRPLSSSSPVALRMHRACRAGCPHFSRGKDRP